LFVAHLAEGLHSAGIETVVYANGESTVNELLRNSMAMLFPIQWNEPFGLVMVEAMACGTPVLAMPGGSVQEVVRDGISGYTCKSVREMVEMVRDLNFDRVAIRRYIADNFSIERMLNAGRPNFLGPIITVA
jgi:glycosyltransferase involved in cell wall biosynthesis